MLSNDHVFSNKKNIHCHPGWLPLERGSTTIYYSLLNQRDIIITSFFMTRRIDDGKMILRKSFPSPTKKVDIDIYVDPAVRSLVLLQTLKLLQENEPIDIIEDTETKEVEYYVIHPILKHLAIDLIGSK